MLDEIAQTIARRTEEFSRAIRNGNYSWLLRLLQLPWHQVRTDLPAAFERNGIAEEYEKVSLHRLLGFALTMGGQGHWAERAAEWLEQGFEPDEKLVQEIDQMVREKRASQKKRHRGFRIAALGENAQSRFPVVT